jgi:hypothetical protein
MTKHTRSHILPPGKNTWKRDVFLSFGMVIITIAGAAGMRWWVRVVVDPCWCHVIGRFLEPTQ